MTKINRKKSPVDIDISLRIQVCPKKGITLHLHSYSKDGIGTLNPTTGMDLDSYGMNVLCCRFVVPCWLGKSLVLEIRASMD